MATETRKSAHRLSAILMADVVGYSRLMSRNEEATVETLGRFRGVFSEFIERHFGRVVDSRGDAIMAEFGAATDAVTCAYEIQAKIADDNQDAPADSRMQFRIGINVGEVLVRGNEIYGGTVNIAARLESLANPGGICVSQPVYDQAKSKLPYSFEDLGERAPKNISEPVRVYRMQAVPGAAPIRTRPARRGGIAGRGRRRGPLLAAVAAGVVVAVFLFYESLPRLPTETAEISVVPQHVKPSIAVLPFATAPLDTAEETFARGIAENLVATLSKIPRLAVISGNAPATDANHTVDARELGRELDVRYVLEGAIHHEGERVRVSVQLVDAMNGESVWAEKFDRGGGHSFDLQDELAQRIVVELDANLISGEDARLSKEGTSKPQAWEAYLFGFSAEQQVTRVDNLRARHHYEQAVALDPSYAEAVARLGWTFMNEVKYGWSSDPPDALARALSLAGRALERYPRQGSAIWLLADHHLMHDRHQDAVSLVLQAAQAQPGSAVAAGAAGFHLLMSGKPADAIPHLSKALELSRVPHPWVLAYLGEAYRQTIRLEMAVQALRQAIYLLPDYLDPHIWLAATYAELDLGEAARRHTDAVRRISPEFSVETLLPYLLHYSNPREVEKLRDSLRRAGLS